MSDQFNEKGFTGKVYFFKNVGCGFYTVHHRRDFTDNYVLVGESDSISVTFAGEAIQAEIESIERQVAEKRAEFQRYLDTIQGRIESLRAISHD